MTRIILKALNFPLLILMILMTISIQSALSNHWLIHFFQPDLMVIVIVWCSLRRSFIEGGIITLFVAEAAEIHSSTPQGLFFISYMTIYLAVRLADHSLVIQNLKTYSMVVLFSSLGLKLIHFIVLSLLGVAYGYWKHSLSFTFLGAVFAATLALWIFRGLERFDFLTYKTDRINHDGHRIQDLDEEFGWNSEGF